ncbi:uncharacterized protein LOC133916551 [Phragmites australis]|uniref:uncharacterized protein LOC133916551 n=1 Tax=Phragmites australis TaxID=29695 RepID=UPI002D7722FD|nr:uncharacterized protein LOC133916551 [Phragmites australis]
MDLSDDWRSLFPVSSVFAPPSLAPPPAASSSSRGPLLFSPFPPPTPLISLPFPIQPRASTRGLHRLVRSFVTATSFLPLSALDSLAGALLAPPSPPFPLPSNLLAVLRRSSSSSPCSLLLFFPYGENAEQLAFVTLDSSTVTGSTPVSLVVQGDGFRHPGHRIQQLAASATESSWPSQLGDSLVEGFLLAASLYSVNWFRVNLQDSDPPVLVPVANYGFDAVVVHACWSRHLPSECIVLLESGELWWFNLNTQRGGKMRVDFGCKDDWGNWLSCDYGAQPWMVIIASSKSIILIDLRFGDHGKYKVLARVGIPGLFETDPFAGADQYLAFCRAGFDNFHFSVVTERYLILLDVRQPLTPLLAWQHGLESPNNVAMFRLSELRPSEEHEWASNSGFAILVGSFWTGEFSVFCYGPKEQGCSENSHLYAWDLPSRFSLTGQCCSCSNAIVKEVFSMPVSRDGPASQESKNPTIGYYVLPNDLSVLEPSFTGFALIRLTALGKLEMQKYRASADLRDDVPCDESQHTSRVSNSSIFPDTWGENFSLRYGLMKLHFLSEHLKGNLCSALVKHDFFVSEQMEQITVSKEVSEYAKDNSSSCSRSVSDFLCNASIPMNIFEIACQRILNGLPSNILHVTFSNYKDMLACSAEKTLCEHLDVPTCLTHNKLRPFLLAKPSGLSDNLTSKVLSSLVGPVLPIHVLLAMEERNKDIESSSQGATAETDSVRDRCREVLEAFDPVISIADMNNCNGWPASQEMNDEKSYFAYEPQIENRFTLDENAKKKEKGDQKLDDPVHTSATPYQDKIFTTFVCGKAEIPDSGAEQAATALFDFGPVRMDFEFPGMEIHPAEEKVYKCLKKQFLTWQNNFRPYQDFCSSHKIQKPKQ